jgi:hypothetical protein
MMSSQIVISLMLEIIGSKIVGILLYSIFGF